MGLAGGPANADGLATASRPAGLVRQADCDVLDQGFAALRDTNTCVRISGYVAAGDSLAPDGRAAGPRAPFGSLQTIVGAPGGPGGVFMHVSHDDFAR